MADRPPGRPPVKSGDPSVSVHLRLPGSQYDAVYQRAQRERLTVPELLRRSLKSPDDDEDSED